MGRFTFFHDYFSTNLRIHKTAMKKMMRLIGNDDECFLLPALIHLANKSDPLYEEFYALPRVEKKNAVRMIEVHGMMKQLRGHQYNIYECTYLDSASYDMFTQRSFWLTCAFSFLIQHVLFIVLLKYNLTKTLDWNAIDPQVFITALLTTIYFAKLSINQANNAITFNRIFTKIGCDVQRNRVILYMNFHVNVILGSCITIFNFFFLLNSANVSDTIINSLALYFILEMDDQLKPDWDEEMYEDAIASASLGYVRASFDEDIEVELDHSKLNIDNLVCSDDNVYVVVNNTTITVHWRKDMAEYESLVFRVSGNDEDSFMENVKNFYCSQNSYRSNNMDNVRLLTTVPSQPFFSRSSVTTRHNEKDS